ncbi:MAG: DUF86 domain-containing protein [Spirochaetia bacterium]|jgi:uncharacterized protein YutE (UPF0331/DUF86 family)|nr:DUF86 domain-containing protein [Spirochaetia bacterium]
MPIRPDNIVLNKASIIERGLNRMMEEYNNNPKLDNYTHVDAMILNIERACQAAIDMAHHLVAVNHLGMPQTSSDAFFLLEKASLITENTTKAMIGMTGFRNIAIHEYQAMNMEVLKAIAEKEYKSLIIFCKEVGITIKLKEVKNGI